MIRARTSDGTFIMGLDAENIRRLQGGEPIYIDLTLLGGHDRIMLMFGKTLQEIVEELKEATGAPLPPAQPYPGDKGPVQ